MEKRFVNRKNFAKTIPDFVRRRHKFPPRWLVVVFISVLAATLTSLKILTPDSFAVTGTIVISAFLFLVLFTAIYLHKNLDIVMATEFQNALFAGAARLNTEFTLIVKEDGTIIYSDIKYNRKFSHLINEGLWGLDALLAHEGLSKENKNRLLRALANGDSEYIPFSMKDPQGGTNQISLVVEPINVRQTLSQDSSEQMALNIVPINRPDGYIFIRAVRKENSRPSIEPLLRQAQFPLYITDTSGNFRHANEAFFRLVEYSSDEFDMGQVTIPQLIEALDKSQTITGYFSDSVIVATKSGRKPMLLNHVEFTDDNDETLRYGFLFPDMTPITKPSVDNVPQALEQGWMYFIEESPIAVALLDKEGNVQQSNPAFRAILEEYHPNLGNEYNLRDVLSYGASELQQFLKENGSKDGSSIDIKIAGDDGMTASLDINTLYETDGSVTGYVAYLIDKTEQKNLELRFAHSQKMQAVGQLAGGIAHDFNNLLTAMMGFCDLLLLRHPAGDPSFADIMQIKQNANRAANLVRQLLAFSRKQTLQPEILDITDVLAELSNLIRRLIGENIELKINHGRDLGLIKVDQGQLEQVLINLAVNARDAMQQGGTLVIQTSNVTVDKNHSIERDLVPPAEDENIEDGEYVLVDVVDTGHGIPKNIIGKIFEPFFSTKEMGSGTGLGLATVYGIIKQTGGYIYVSSTPKGTKFSIFLKRYANNKNAEKPVIESEIADKAISADLTGKGTILLVEDEAPVRIFSAQALSNKGYTVLEADCGEAALRVVAERGAEIEMIITDVIMPGMNGPTMIEEVNKTYPDMKVIFISGYAEDAFIKTYGTERKFNFLPKPFTLKQLAGKVKEIMEKEGA